MTSAHALTVTAGSSATSTYTHPAIANSLSASCLVTYTATSAGVAVSTSSPGSLVQYNSATRTFTFTADTTHVAASPYAIALTATDVMYPTFPATYTASTLTVAMTLTVTTGTVDCTGTTLQASAVL